MDITELNYNSESENPVENDPDNNNIIQNTINHNTDDYEINHKNNTYIDKAKCDTSTKSTSTHHKENNNSKKLSKEEFPDVNLNPQRVENVFHGNIDVVANTHHHNHSSHALHDPDNEHHTAFIENASFTEKLSFINFEKNNITNNDHLLHHPNTISYHHYHHYNQSHSNHHNSISHSKLKTDNDDNSHDRNQQDQNFKYYKDILTIQKVLDMEIPKHMVSKRAGPGNHRIQYLDVGTVIHLMNETFGWNGWKSVIKNLNIQFSTFDDNLLKWRSCVYAVIKISVNINGIKTSHEDIGWGSKLSRDQAESIGDSAKEAVSDALKRASRIFGNRTGNGLWDKHKIEDEHYYFNHNSENTTSHHQMNKNSPHSNASGNNTNNLHNNSTTDTNYNPSPHKILNNNSHINPNHQPQSSTVPSKKIIPKQFQSNHHHNKPKSPILKNSKKEISHKTQFHANSNSSVFKKKSDLLFQKNPLHNNTNMSYARNDNHAHTSYDETLNTEENNNLQVDDKPILDSDIDMELIDKHILSNSSIKFNKNISSNKNGATLNTANHPHSHINHQKPFYSNQSK